MLKILSVIIEHGVMDLNHPFSYAYLGEKRVEEGMRVKVAFGHSELIGFIIGEVKESPLSLEEYNASSPFPIKEIEEVVDEEPVLNEELILLAQEASSYYVCPLIEILKVMLPPSLRPDSVFLNKPKRAYKEVYALSGKTYSEADLDRNEIKLLTKLKEAGQGMSKSEISSKITLAKLINKGLVELVREEKLRLPFIEDIKQEDHELNEEQKKAYEEIKTSKDKVFLLQGVTGSGKTEIYIKLIKDNLLEGKGALILVPEISLTDRMITLFKSIFGDKVALIHSGLTDGQKYDEYVRVARGDASIVVGARSAVFAPIVNLSLIIIDEEHVESYKQDTMPFYDARKIALMRIRQKGGKLVFGSATPSLECRARADKGLYHLVRLDHRFASSELPEVSIVDLADFSNIDYQSTLLSLPLRKKIAETLEKKEQVILLLNRRGYAPVYTCRYCQKVLKCPNCNLPLTLHKGDREIKCHHCDYVLKTDDLVCPNCGHKDFIYTGFGTERIEEELHGFFPSAKIVRFDADATRQKGKYHQIITDFSLGKYDIMVGTQMVAKGHDFPKVTLACALLADSSLEFPSYKADEDTFDLLTQLAGRAGRKGQKGYAIIQTYSKDNPIIALSVRQDYEAFYDFEMKNRHDRQYPPYVYLANIHISAASREGVERAAYLVKNYLIKELASSSKRASLFGPAKPYIEKLANRYYRVIMIKYKDRSLIDASLRGLNVLQMKASDVRLTLDIDPSSDI
jgi:primosomal protein N' (replication factor Y) (superfamily II helicase)